MVIALAGVLSGCAGSPHRLTTEPASATVLKAASATVFTEGRDFEYFADAPPTIDGRTAAFAGMTDDGTEVLVVEDAGLVAFDRNGEHPISLSAQPVSPSQVSVSGDRVVWLEPSGADSATVRSHDLSSGTTDQIGDASPTSAPVILEDSVYYRRAGHVVRASLADGTVERATELDDICALAAEGLRVTCAKRSLLIDSAVFGSYRVRLRESLVDGSVVASRHWVAATTRGDDGATSWIVDLTRNRLMRFDPGSVDLARMSLLPG